MLSKLCDVRENSWEQVTILRTECTTLKAYRKLSSSCEIEIMRVISNELKVIGSDGLDLLGVLRALCLQERAQIT